MDMGKDIAYHIRRVLGKRNGNFRNYARLSFRAPESFRDRGAASAMVMQRSLR